jgi:competence protein ComEC
MEWWIEEEIRDARGRQRPPRRRALTGLALTVVAGTAAGLGLPWPPMLFWGGGALLLLPLFVWVRRRGSVAPLMLAAFCLAAAHAGLATRGRPALSLAAALARPSEYIQFVAVVLDDAVPRPNRPGQAADAVFPARVEGLNRDGTWRRVEDRVRIVVRGDLPAGRRPLYGERWWFRGIVNPAVPRRSGLFLLPENQAIIDRDRARFMDAGRGNRIKTWCLERRRAARVVLGRGLEDFPEPRGLLQALLLGYREDLPAVLRQDFAATGTVHIFAISGAHVGMVTLLLAGLLRLLGIPLNRWFPILTPLLAGYVITTGAATSAVRAGVMASLLVAGPFLRRRPDAVTALAAAAMVILLVAPAQLADLGFLLSFTAVGGLLAVQPVLDAWVARLFRRDEWQLPGEELPANCRRRAAGL